MLACSASVEHTGNQAQPIRNNFMLVRCSSRVFQQSFNWIAATATHETEPKKTNPYQTLDG